jgi:hypothetical protein
VAIDTSDMAGPSGTASFSGAVDVTGASVDLHAILRPALAQAPTLGIRISGTRRISELADVTRWRSEQAGK